MRGQVRWYYDSLTPRLRALPFLLDAATEEALEELAEEVESYMHREAPWEDQSGAARDGLRAEYNDAGLFKHEIILYHSVDYGIWLEVRWNGRYAIIQPTIEHFGPQVMSRLSLFGRIG